MKKLSMALAAMLMSCAALAQQATPVGVWKTIDDKTKVEKSLVRITEAGGALTGRIEKLLDPAAKPDAVCEECTDERKGKPILGMTILNGVKKNAEHEGLWDGGTILDPNNGKTYKVRLKPAQDGKTLEVRGYVGMPMLGRSQTWIRVE